MCYIVLPQFSLLRPAMLKLTAAFLGGVAVGLGAFAVASLPPAPARPGSAGAPSLAAATTTTAPWVASWGASPQPPADNAAPVSGFTDQTVRDVVYASAGGSALRVRISNLYGTTPLVIGEASIGTVLSQAYMMTGLTRMLTFAGKESVTIPAHGTVTSDPAAKAVTPLTELAISIFLPDATGPLTNHLESQQDTFVASGNHSTDASATAFTTTLSSWFLATELDVQSPAAHGAVVAFGDSITDGYRSAADSQARYPNYLARRLAAASGASAPGVVDAGITGNRLLASACGGESAEARFDRDALTVSGVRAVILLEGINDLIDEGQPNACGATPTITAAAIEGGYRQLISLAHSHGVKVYLGTLTPNPGLPTQRAEQRQAVNNWILASHTAGISDGVINFASTLADPLNPVYLNPSDNSGDNLHPSDLGYETMANAIPLSWVQ